MDESGKLARWREKNKLPKQHYEKTFEDLRDIWIQDGRYSELTAFINENWDSGNGDEFVKPFSEHLIKNKELSQFKKLWKGILRHRIGDLWITFDIVKSNNPNITLDKIKSQNLNGFNQFSSQESQIRRLSWNRNYALKGIDEYIQGLKEMNDKTEIEKTERLYQTIENLIKQKPKTTTDKRKIDETLFWNLIESCRTISEDKFEFIEKLSNKLEEFKSSEIRKFERIFRTKYEKLNREDLWALAYIVRKGCGDDGFDYFKAWVISKGQNAFNAINEMRTNEVQQYFDEDPQLEEIMYLAENVYESKTGELMPPVKVKKNKMKKLNWTEESLETDFPELCEIFEYKNKSN